MKIEYRTLTLDDIDFYRQIRLECLRNYPDNFGTLYENETLSRELKFDSILKQGGSSSFLKGAFCGELLVGICGFTREDTKKTRHRGVISHMYIRKIYQRKGIGKAILKATIDEAFSDDTLEIIELGVVSNNKDAISLYANIGFTPNGEFEKYFKQHDKYQALTFMTLTKENFKSCYK